MLIKETLKSSFVPTPTPMVLGHSRPCEPNETSPDSKSVDPLILDFADSKTVSSELPLFISYLVSGVLFSYIFLKS